MKLGRSEILTLVYSEAEMLRKKYRSSNLSQVHILCALISVSLRGDEHIRTHAEIVDALALLPFAKETLANLLAQAAGSLKQNPLTTYEEATALEDWYELAEITATLAGENQVNTPVFIRKIVENLTENTRKQFPFPVAENEKVKKAVSPSQNEPQVSQEVQEDMLEDLELFEEMDDFPEMESIEEVAGNSIGDVMESIKQIQNTLRKNIYGQDEAIFSVVSGYFNTLVRNTIGGNGKGPRATFLFAGAPGVGKTYLAQMTARAMHLPFRRFDMSSFSDKEAPLEFAGSDKVYRNGHEGLVTGFVRENPKCVLLFDEIEKAHMNIIHLFLQILDIGRLKDSHTGKNVSFENAIIIMTTNAGKTLYENLEPGAPMPGRKVIVNALATEVNPVTGNKFFPEAICSRFAAGNIVLFNPLGAQELLNIGQTCLADYAEDFKENFHIDLTFDNNLCAALLFAEGGRVDARALKGRASNFVSSEAYNWIRFAHEKEEISLENITQIRLVTDVGDQDTAKLFSIQKKPTILLYSERPDTFAYLGNPEKFHFLIPADKQQAEEWIATEEIDLAICDIFGNEATTLNIEDTASQGRRLMDTLIKERIPVLVYSTKKRTINNEERQALSEIGASGFFERDFPQISFVKLEEICKRVHNEKMLRDLGRARKVLAFDCTYDWDGGSIGIINLKNMRIIPAIDAQDQPDIVGLCATDTTFDSIIGAEDAKDELKGFISYLKEPRAYAKNSVPAPKGIILYGPPGTGKTMLAKALAHESGATFIATQGNNFLSGRLGAGAQEVKRLFAMARKYAPSVLFIDEIDIVAKNRMTDGTAGDVINALLNEMDGFSTNPSRPVFVLAATNFDVSYGASSALDPALLRRFDRRIFVDLPNRQERMTFIHKRLTGSRQVLSDTLVENIALRSTGMSLAELEAVIDFALRGMLQKGLPALTDQLLDEAFETYRYGEKTEWDESTLHRIAVHEAGHVVISYLAGNKPTYVTVAGRSNYGGYMQVHKENSVQTKKHLLDTIRTALAGRAAEMVFFGEEDGISVGAADDLKVATEIAMRMITVYGMHNEHGLAFDNEGRTREQTLGLCNRILADELDKAVALLTANHGKTQNLVDVLMRKNHLIGNEIGQILAK